MRTNPHDDATAAAARSDQDDPWAMYLAIEASSAEPPGLGTALRLAARGCIALAESELATSEKHAEAFAAWYATSFRKVAVRAHSKRWRRLLPLPGVTVSEGSDERSIQLHALVPMRKSQRGRPVNDAQAMTLELPEQLATATGSAWAAQAQNGVVLALNPEVSMSSGKAMAQVGHAVMMLHAAMSDDERAAWAADDHRLAVVRPGPTTWTTLTKHPDVWGVRDAGLTEVDPGTLTVIAAPPGLWVCQPDDRVIL
jgi:peptidyl-tRNA hydrolase